MSRSIMAGHPSHSWSAFNPVTGADLDVPRCSRCGAKEGSEKGIAECTLPTTGLPERSQAQALSTALIERMKSSILCVSNSEGAVIATAIVWDYTTTDVLILTNYHTWDCVDFRYCFPPDKERKKSKTGAAKRKTEVVTFHNDIGFSRKVSICSSTFHSYERDEDFAVLKIPRDGFELPRIPISLAVPLALKIHAFGYIGHTKQFNVTGGEISGIIPEGFVMTLLSAGGFSGAAILADGYGRAVGYMGGNLDASKDKNSQHQSYAFRFDRVARATNRQELPTNSPAEKSVAQRGRKGKPPIVSSTAAAGSGSGASHAQGSARTSSRGKRLREDVTEKDVKDSRSAAAGARATRAKMGKAGATG